MKIVLRASVTHAEKAPFNSTPCTTLGLSTPEGVCFCSQTHFFPLLWELNVLRLADAFQNLLKGADCLPRKMHVCAHAKTRTQTHSLPPCLTHTPPSFPLFLSPSLSYTSSFKQKHWLLYPTSKCWPTRRSPWVTPPRAPSRTVPLRARAQSSQPESFTWGGIVSHVSEQYHHCPLPLPEELGAGGLGSRAHHTTECGFSDPGSRGRGTECWVSCLTIPRSLLEGDVWQAFSLLTCSRWQRSRLMSSQLSPVNSEKPLMLCLLLLVWCHPRRTVLGDCAVALQQCSRCALCPQGVHVSGLFSSSRLQDPRQSKPLN